MGKGEYVMTIKDFLNNKEMLAIHCDTKEKSKGGFEE